MNFEIRRTNSYTREITVTVEWANLEGAFERAVARFRQRVHLPGFRHGKVPHRIVVQKFGPGIEADFAQESVQEYFSQALKENDISPVSQAKIDHISFRKGERLEFTATFEVEPEVELINYKKKFRVKKNVYIADEEDVDLYVEELQRQYAELHGVESGSELGHLLLVDMQELDRTGVPIIGRKVQDRYVKVGEGVFGGDNLDRLRGLKAGDETVIEAQTRNEGPPQKYGLSIKNVQQEVFPEVNEDFIRKVDKSAADEGEFREHVQQRIVSRLQRDSEIQLKESIIDYFVQNTILEVPESMVEAYIENALEDARQNNGSDIDEEKFSERIRAPAFRNIKWYLIRKAVIEAEQISVSEDEIEGRTDRILENSGEERNRIQRFYRKPSNRDHLKEDIRDQKLFDHLRLFAKIDEVEIHTKDLRKQRSSSTIHAD